MLQGLDDQTDKNVIPFINAAQNAPRYITNDFLYPR